MLRGVYLTSGTQEGTPIDRLTGVMARAFGLDQRRAASLRPEQGRSYFLGRLVSEVILGEAMLVSEPPGARLGGLLLRAASFAARCSADSRRRGLACRTVGRPVSARSTRCRRRWPPTRRSPRRRRSIPVNDSDLPRLLPLLDAGPRTSDRPRAARRASWSSFDLSQTAKLRAGARHGLSACSGLCAAAAPDLAAGSANARQLHPTRLPLRGHARLPDARRPGPLDRALVKEWMTYDWQAAYAGAVNTAVLTGLRRHLDALLAQPLPRGAAGRCAGRAGAHGLQPGSLGSARLFAHQAVGGRPEPCRRGDPSDALDAPACAFSYARPARS